MVPFGEVFSIAMLIPETAADVRDLLCASNSRENKHHIREPEGDRSHNA